MAGPMDFSAVRRWWPLAGVTGLLAAAALAAAHSSPRITQSERPLWDGPKQTADSGQEILQPSFLEDQPTEMPPAQAPVEMPGWVATAATRVVLLAVAAVVGFLLWVLIRDIGRRFVRRVPADRPDPAAVASPADTAKAVAAALDAGLADLSDSDADPRRTVIACWVRLEEAAAAAGTPRQIGDTPTDLVSRLLRTHHVSADVLSAFADVYREARYATHAVDERMRRQARTALQRLRTELGAGSSREVAP
ncbi:MAG TPA: DUF4129 domain-containing protein [Micromonosporaceae bacterium]|nr:DUF4129 domain-containing protein [Micromonosporaceae bacterium]